MYTHVLTVVKVNVIKFERPMPPRTARIRNGITGGRMVGVAQIHTLKKYTLKKADMFHLTTAIWNQKIAGSATQTLEIMNHGQYKYQKELN